MRCFCFLTALVLVASAMTVETPASARTRHPHAPIGHRQPRVKDIPPDTQKRDQHKVEELDKLLDKKLKGICRGC